MEYPKYLTNKNPRKKGRKGEKLVAESINSGAFWIDKGDLHYNKYLIEVKTTSKKSFRVSQTKLKKIFEEAYTIGKEPLFVIVLPEFIVKILIQKR